MGVGEGAGAHHLTEMTADMAFAAYEAVRDRLPPALAGGACREVDTLDDVAEDFDIFLLDAFGVLNIGESAIPGVVERVAGLRARGKRCIVVTNAAGYPHALLMERYLRLGYAFPDDDVISSRATLLSALRCEPPARWGLMATRRFGLADLEGLDLAFLAEDPALYAEVDGFVLMGSAEWTETRQRLLEEALLERPRPVWVGNPDIVAPRDVGFSIEPGHFAHRLADNTGVSPRFFGKPFRNIYDLVFAHLDGPIDPRRVLMVGDSLHTDVLGAQTAGIASALVAGYGFFAGHDIMGSIERSGIRPDLILGRP